MKNYRPISRIIFFLNYLRQLNTVD